MINTATSTMIIKSSINFTLILSTIVDVKDVKKKIEDVICTPSTKYKFYRACIPVFFVLYLFSFNHDSQV